MLALRAFSLLGKRAISTSVCLRAHGHGLEVSKETFYPPRHEDTPLFLEVPFPPPIDVDIPLTPEQKALKEKEKSSWSDLSAEEKIALYRMKFPHTLSELYRSSMPEWKTAVGGSMFLIGLLGFIFIWMQLYINPPLPPTMSEDWKAMQTKKMLDMRVNPIQGLSSKWDYEKNDWKK